VPERIEYIAGLMADDVWNERTTKILRRALAAKWGVAESTILNYSTEAGRSIDEAIKERRAPIAARAIERLELLAETCADSTIPGDSGSAVRANEILLKVTGYSEPEEDKKKSPTTVVVVGQVGTSPAMKALATPREVPQLVLTIPNTDAHSANGQSNGVKPDGSTVRKVDGRGEGR